MGQQFAITAVAPRSIAWLVHQDDWPHIEEIVAFNCALLGGYFNALIPLVDGGITDEYVRFLIQYDPDLIVLAPGMPRDSLDPLLERTGRLDPFAIAPWEAVPLIAKSDPRIGGTPPTGAPAPFDTRSPFPRVPEGVVVAVANRAHPDTSRLALVSCGDFAPVLPGQGTSPRDAALAGLLTLEHIVGDHTPYVNETTGTIRTHPSREQLADLLPAQLAFPLTGTCRILDACLRLQLRWFRKETFIGRTVPYDLGNYAEETWSRWADTKYPRPPGVVVLVSDRFGIDEAALFWNLRACQAFVAWLPLAVLSRDISAVGDWLGTSHVRQYLQLNPPDVAFAAPERDLSTLRMLHDTLAQSLGDQLSRGCLAFADLITMCGASNRPMARREQTILMTHEGACSFLPSLPTSPPGLYTVTLMSDDFMLPRCRALVPQFVAPHTTIQSAYQEPNADTPIWLTQRCFRTTESRYLKAQIVPGDSQPLTCHMPSPAQIVEGVFTANGRFTRLEPSSVASYHRHFIERAGGLEKAVYYLTTSPYKEVLFTLADAVSPQGQQPGWLLERPARRRALRHLDIQRIVGLPVPESTDNYVRSVAQRLPTEVAELLEKQLLERGFVLTCSSCRYQSWYPTEQVGQRFRCACCYQTQVYHSSPLWLYKLPEVIYLGLDQDMHVPFLALNYMKARSLHQFSWVPDSDVYWLDEGKERRRNLDIICLSDGHLYVGEAKSNDEIDEGQLGFYEELLAAVPIDGIIVATARPQWRPNTAARIVRLKECWGERITDLTGQQLDVIGQLAPS